VGEGRSKVGGKGKEKGGEMEIGREKEEKKRK
jgi:hypothetical protein